MADEPVSAWSEPFSARGRGDRRSGTGPRSRRRRSPRSPASLGYRRSWSSRPRPNRDRRGAAPRDRANLDSGPLPVRCAGTVRPGRRRHQDVPHRRQRGLPAQGGKVQGAARPALESASDFYGKLSALLGKETDLASRRALASANFELAGLTAKVGRNDDALAAHRSVLAAQRGLAASRGPAPRTGRGRPQPDGSRRAP